MSRSRKFKRQWTLVAEGISRGRDGEMTFVEETLNKTLGVYVESFGVIAQDTKITIETEDLLEK